MISFIFYNPQDQQLRLQFEGGEVYDYYLVESSMGRAAEVALAGDNPDFFKTRIKGVYPHRRIA